MLLFFFFQAEDGIRDYKVTGVQTCALPICTALSTRALSPDCALYGVEPEAGNDGQQSLRAGRIVHIETPKTIADGAQTQHRSEEHTSELQSPCNLVCRLLLEKKKKKQAENSLA